MLLDYPEVQFFFKMRIFLFTAQFLAYTNTNIPTLPLFFATGLTRFPASSNEAMDTDEGNRKLRIYAKNAVEEIIN